MSTVNYLDFDLLINRAETGYSVRVLRAPADADRAIGEFLLPFSDTEIENFLLKIGRSRRIARGLESPQTGEAKRFGGRLFESVFSEEVRVCLRKSLDLAVRQDAGLRLRLHLRGAPALADLPWEYLYDTSLNRFLALSADTPLVRYLELPEAVRSLQIELPLRVLVMISSPPGHPKLDVEREWANVNDALVDVRELGLVVVERLEAATLTALQRKLRRGAYHIFHFIGHGEFNEDAQDGVLLLEGEDTGLGQPVTGQDLGVMLRDHRPLRLVILNACEGARASRTDPFAGTAQSIVQQGIPALIAMQFEISDDAAIAFSHEFYGALADGYPVDAALAEARKGIYAKATDLEWGTPVLYLRAPDGYIFNLTTAGQAGALHGQPPPVTPPADKAAPVKSKEVRPKEPRPRQPTPTAPRRSPEPAPPPVDVEALWTEALVCFWEDNCDWARAVALLQEVVAYAPDHAAAAEKLAHARRQLTLAEGYAQGRQACDAGDWAAAVTHLEAVTGLDAGYRDAAALLVEAKRRQTLAEYYEEARRLFQARAWQVVVNVFERIHGLDSAYPDPEGMLASAQATVASQERERRLTGIYRQAIHDMDAGRFAEALRGLEQLAGESPGYKQTATLLARVRKIIADREAEAQRQREAADLLALAQAALAGQDWDAAEAALRRAQELDPARRPAAAELLAGVNRGRELAAQCGQAQAHLDAGRWDEAIAGFEQVAKLDPGFSIGPGAAVSELLARSRQAKLEAERRAEAERQAQLEAEARERRAAQEAEQQAAAKRAARLAQLYDSAAAWLRAGEWNTALPQLDELQQLAPGYRDVEALIAEAHRGQADEEAAAQRQAALAASYRHAEAALAAGDWPCAAKLLAQIEAAEPGYRDAGERLAAAQRQIDLAELFGQGAAHFDTARWAQALQAFREVTRLDPDYTDRDRGRAADLLLRARRKKELAELPRPAAPKPGPPRPGDKPKTLPK